MSMQLGSNWDPGYEWKAVLLMSLGFGLVNLDRFIIYPLFPVMMHDLNLNYQDLGLISAVLAIAWGVASVFAGRHSDRVGRRQVIIPSVMVFSMLAGLTGLAGSVASLLLIRAIMGVAEGAYTPTSIAATAEASKPSRVGMNVGIQQLSAPLIGMGLAPVLATQLLHVVPSWRWIFVMVSLPGFFLAWKMYRIMRDTHAAAGDAEAPHHRWFEVLRYRNVVLNTMGQFCWLTCLIVLSAMMPNYLTDYLHLSLDQMGFVMSAFGIGGAFGMFVLPMLSDRVGRKPVLLLALLIELPLLLVLINTGPSPGTLFVLICAIACANAGAVVLTVGPLTAESVPHSLISTATGVVVGLGEIVGGGIAPALAGGLAQAHGIQVILYIGTGGIVAGIFVALAMRETLPRMRTAIEPKTAT
jgi:MFS family permease